MQSWALVYSTMGFAEKLACFVLITISLHSHILCYRLFKIPVATSRRLVSTSPEWVIWPAILTTGIVYFAAISLSHDVRFVTSVMSPVYHCTKRWMPVAWHVITLKLRGMKFPWLLSFTQYEYSEYEYSELPESHVRLVRINGRFCRHRFELLQFRLEECPTYDAISYTWDGQTRDRVLRLGDAHLRVTKNASIILRGSIPLIRSRYIWIDSICINQNELDEKETQICLMQKIYQRAACVRLWLLPPKGLENVVRPPEWEHNSRVRVILENIFTIRNIVFGNDLEKLLSHPYWHRVWIIQELAVSQKSIVHFGHYVIDWNTLLEFAEEYWPPSLDLRFQVELSSLALQFERGASSNIFRGIRQISTIGHLQRKVGSGVWPSVSTLLTDFAGCRATNPLDNVYGLTGISSSEFSASVATNATILPKVDYRSSPLKVYTNTIKAAIRFRKAYTAGDDDFASEVLVFGGVGWPRSVTGLPSWVTDWSSLPDCLLDSFTRFRLNFMAGGHNLVKTFPNYVVRGTSLLVSGGCRIDSLTAITQVIDHDKPDRPWFSEICDIVGSQLSLLKIKDMGIPTFNRDYRPYPARWQGAIFRTLIGEPSSYWGMDVGMGVGDGLTYDRPDAYRNWNFRHGLLTAAGLREYEHRGTFLNHRDLRYAFDLWANLPLITQRVDDIVRTSILRDRPKLQGKRLRKEITERAQSLRLEIQEHCAQFIFVCRQQTQGRCFALTKTGYMCLVPPRSQIGDELFVFEALRLPYLIRRQSPLRPVRNQPSTVRGHLVGSCFVLGLMEGEGTHAPEYYYQDAEEPWESVKERWESGKETVVLL